MPHGETGCKYAFFKITVADHPILVFIDTLIGGGDVMRGIRAYYQCYFAYLGHIRARTGDYAPPNGIRFCGYSACKGFIRFIIGNIKILGHCAAPFFQ